MKIENCTNFREDHIEVFLKRVAQTELDSDQYANITFIIDFEPGLRTPDGKPTYGVTLNPREVQLTLPRDGPPDKVNFAHTIAHECAHVRGMSEEECRGDPRYGNEVSREIYSWAEHLPLERKAHVELSPGGGLVPTARLLKVPEAQMRQDQPAVSDDAFEVLDEPSFNLEDDRALFEREVHSINYAAWVVSRCPEPAGRYLALLFRDRKQGDQFLADLTKAFNRTRKKGFGSEAARMWMRVELEVMQSNCTREAAYERVSDKLKAEGRNIEAPIVKRMEMAAKAAARGGDKRKKSSH